MELHRGKVLNTLTEMYLILCSSYKSLCWLWQLQDASCMEKLVECIAQVWFWPILPSKHKQSSNVEGSVGFFYELWSLVLSIDFLFDSSQVIGWAILAALFSFSETNWELCLRLFWALLSCWNVNPCFIFIIGVGTEPANIHFHWQGTGLLSNYWLAFHAFLHLPFFMCSILFPVSFHFMTHNLISEFICFVLFVCMDYLGCYRHLVKISCQQHL